RHRGRGGLLHHPFTLTPAPRGVRRRSALCGTVPRIAPGGCYPPPCRMEPGLSSAPGPGPRGRGCPADWSATRLRRPGPAPGTPVPLAPQRAQGLPGPPRHAVTDRREWTDADPAAALGDEDPPV